MRAFIALGVSEEVRARLERVQLALKITGAHVSWVPIRNVHFSLAFLGEISEDHALALGQSIQAISGETESFSYEVDRIGFFGSSRSPKVIWAGVKNQEPLSLLYGRLVEALICLGMRVEDREFMPHLTLGRVRSSRGHEALAAALEKAGSDTFGVVPVDRIMLMRSLLLPTGAEYSIIKESILADA